ncbi:TetR/AcrR family transcriptional regulator [Cryobacterium sp. PH31-O1]|uniref:TetR/AcrR family transcriptional regulator n=1 Tax=Cryobacterium sp. PH31-O1 TaxID=3046306 RepID=UPI0024B9070F|nr:TetR/AcrR family transcriptional regulator [Cryobacterium sp. PH31-O1]MDJ0337284.1 TetR/AcrR family transcriptional regulator [Cryobacterium sp. PH31-O1]
MPNPGVPSPAINETHQRILESAVRLFADRGFHGTGIRDLAASAQLSTASLYHYMGTKERLLFQIMHDALQRLVLAASIIEAQSEDVRVRLDRLVRMHVVTHALSRDASNVVDNQVGALDPVDRLVIVEQRDAYERFWAHAIRDGVDAGFFHVPDQSSARMAILEMCSGVARWYSAGGKYSVDEIADIHVDLAASLLHGGGTRFDREQVEPNLDIHELVESIWAIRLPERASAAAGKTPKTKRAVR